MAGTIYRRRNDLVTCISCKDKYTPRDGDDMKCYPCFNSMMKFLRKLPEIAKERKAEEVIRIRENNKARIAQNKREKLLAKKLSFLN